MSEELIDVGGLHIGSFYGGSRGRCIQFTPHDGRYAQLSRDEVMRVVVALSVWLWPAPEAKP